MDPYNSNHKPAPKVAFPPATTNVQPTAAEVAAVRKAIDLHARGYHVDERGRMVAVQGSN
jgi:hypothetical protein